MKNPLELAQIFRSNSLESVHLGHICLINSQKKIRSWGDAKFSCFTRSCIKPIQAKISKQILGSDLSNEFLAIACGSHLAEPEQIKVINNFLSKFNISPSEILCGYHSKSRGELCTNLEHNCSGKHTAIVAACKKQGWDSSKYLELEHPYNQLLLKELKALSGLTEIVTGYDDCGLPSFHMSLEQMTKVFLNLTRNPEYQEIISTMNKFPFLVGGQNQIDSILMNKHPGKFLAKGGAEGLMIVCNLEKEESLALKILDGSNRAKAVITSKVLYELGWTTEDLVPVKVINDSKGNPVAEIRPKFQS